MENTKKIIFFDIDQTLYNPKTKSIPTSTIKAIKTLSENPDIEIAIATGRAFYMLHVIEEIKQFIDIYVTINGQIIIKDNQIIYQNPIDKKQVKHIVNTFEKHNLKYGFLGADTETLNIVDEKGKKAFELVDMHLPKVDPHFYQTNDVYQMWAFCEQKKHKVFKEAFSDLEVVSWLGDGFDVLSKGMSKQKGIEKIIEILQIPHTNTYAIGDGDNDIEMLSFVHHSVAMGNATKKAKEVAKYTTTTIENNGVARALKQLNLL